jgi:hypothetical protein
MVNILFVESIDLQVRLEVESICNSSEIERVHSNSKNHTC